MPEYLFIDRTIKIISDDEIRKFIDCEIELMGDYLECIEITWNQSPEEYFLEIGSVTQVQSSTSKVEAVSKHGRYMTLGSVFKTECNSLGRIRAAGRQIYYRLIHDYPMIRRNLGSTPRRH